VTGPDVRPAGPGFSSYDGAEVAWLLTDLSAVTLELGTREREEAVRGGRHYSEMLPVEYAPGPAYLSLFRRALAASADRLALAVGLAAELLLERHEARAAPGPPVLVSLARAGTPIGILLRRWLVHTHGLAAPHYTVSIVRGRGLDAVALGWLLARHPAAALRFVDGWTGKGAIARELAAAVDAAGVPGLDAELTVLADPGSCTSLYGTRDDFLVPSACLNSTVSGLVSRTVLRPDLTGPGRFHGAKGYPALAAQDVSAEFLDAVSDRFRAVEQRVLESYPAHAGGDRAPTWRGAAEVARVATAYGVRDQALVKPGVGETTRVLLRRVPERVLLRAGAPAGDLAHVRLLAAERAVPVEEVPELGYSCVGLIRSGAPE
jgi:hypothetical protein